MLRILPQLLAALSMFRPVLPLGCGMISSRASLYRIVHRDLIVYIYFHRCGEGFKWPWVILLERKRTRKELHYNIERRRVGLDISLNILSSFCDPTRPCGV